MPTSKLPIPWKNPNTGTPGYPGVPKGSNNAAPSGWKNPNNGFAGYPGQAKLTPQNIQRYISNYESIANQLGNGIQKAWNGSVPSYNPNVYGGLQGYPGVPSGDFSQ